jgi:NAD(P)H-hydrate epimerase
MKVATTQQMQAIDRRTIEEIGIPGLVLMENAGLQTVLAMERFFGSLRGKKICLVCGKGNNGGDGLVIARHLHNRGGEVSIVLLGRKTDIKRDAKVNLEIALMMNLALVELVSEDELCLLDERMASSQIIVDAIFGTGLRDAPRSFYQQVIGRINASSKPVVAVDIPTGLSASTGEILGCSIQAALTVTFGLPKVGLVYGINRQYAGQLEVADISIPKTVIEDAQIKLNLLEKEYVASLFKKRKLDTHKGDYGHVLVIAGSMGKTGAAVLAATAALRAGAGLVTLAVPQGVHHIIEVKTTEVMSVPLPETDRHTISQAAEESILRLAEQVDAVAIGPGLTTHPETSQLINEIVTSLEIPVVADADAINAMPLSSLKYTRSPLIITPHPGEMGRLLDVPTSEIQANRLEAVQKTAEACNTYVVLKGDRTLIADPEGNIYINPTGNPGMATAGSGDILTGMIAGFVAQGLGPLPASNAGVYIHGLAGDLAAGEKGEMGLLAGDVLEQIPTALRQVTG